MRTQNRIRLATSLVVVCGMLAGASAAFAATQDTSWGYDYLSNGGMNNFTQTADMGAQTNSNYILIDGGSQTINWGDGAESTGGINVGNPAVTWYNSDFHTYTSAPGVSYQVTLTGYITLENTYYGTNFASNFSGLSFMTQSTP